MRYCSIPIVPSLSSDSRKRDRLFRSEPGSVGNPNDGFGLEGGTDMLRTVTAG
jgi:hypothetical protein